jgi:hypothetical protein
MARLEAQLGATSANSLNACATSEGTQGAAPACV